MIRFLAYLWRVAVNLVYLLVVAAVLLSIRDMAEKSIIALLGLIYVSIRSTAIIQGIAYTNVISAFDARLDQIQYQLDGSFEMPDRADQRDALRYQHYKLYIDLFFLGLISIACLWAFFAASQAPGT